MFLNAIFEDVFQQVKIFKEPIEFLMPSSHSIGNIFLVSGCSCRENVGHIFLIMAIPFALLSRFKIVLQSIFEYHRINIHSSPVRAMKPDAISRLNTDPDFISKTCLFELVRAPWWLVRKLLYRFPNSEVHSINRHQTGLTWSSPNESVLQINLHACIWKSRVRKWINQLSWVVGGDRPRTYM